MEISKTSAEKVLLEKILEKILLVVQRIPDYTGDLEKLHISSNPEYNFPEARGIERSDNTMEITDFVWFA